MPKTKRKNKNKRKNNRNDVEAATQSTSNDNDEKIETKGNEDVINEHTPAAASSLDSATQDELKEENEPGFNYVDIVTKLKSDWDNLMSKMNQLTEDMHSQKSLVLEQQIDSFISKYDETASPVFVSPKASLLVSASRLNSREKHDKKRTQNMHYNSDIGKFQPVSYSLQPATADKKGNKDNYAWTDGNPATATDCKQPSTEDKNHSKKSTGDNQTIQSMPNTYKKDNYVWTGDIPATASFTTGSNKKDNISAADIQAGAYSAENAIEAKKIQTGDIPVAAYYTSFTTKGNKGDDISDGDIQAAVYSTENAIEGKKGQTDDTPEAAYVTKLSTTDTNYRKILLEDIPAAVQSHICKNTSAAEQMKNGNYVWTGDIPASEYYAQLLSTKGKKHTKKPVGNSQPVASNSVNTDLKTRRTLKENKTVKVLNDIEESNRPRKQFPKLERENDILAGSTSEEQDQDHEFWHKLEDFLSLKCIEPYIEEENRKTAQAKFFEKLIELVSSGIEMILVRSNEEIAKETNVSHEKTEDSRVKIGANEDTAKEVINSKHEESEDGKCSEAESLSDDDEFTELDVSEKIHFELCTNGDKHVFANDDYYFCRFSESRAITFGFEHADVTISFIGDNIFISTLRSEVCFSVRRSEAVIFQTDNTAQTSS